MYQNLKEISPKNLKGFLLPILFVIALFHDVPSYAFKNATFFRFENLVLQDSLKTVKGKVIDADSSVPLFGATIKILETNIGTMTDSEGRFSLEVPEDKMLQISYVGYRSKKINLQNYIPDTIIQLKIDNSLLEEVVVIGYGKKKRRKLTGAIAKIKTSALENQEVMSFQEKLAGKLAGVNISQTTGAPGGNISISVRGTGSITAGNAPLVVLDGFPVSDDHNSASVQGSRPGSGSEIYENTQNALSSLNPDDIASVEVLKDAAAAAIYGSRGANGVILVTTKRGKEGRPKFDFKNYYGFQQVSKTYQMMDAYQYAEQNYIARSNGGELSSYPNELIPYLNDEPGLTNTDWQAALFRTAPIENYNLSVHGGSRKTKYFVSGNYAGQKGIVRGSGFKRYSLRTNLDIEFNKRVTFGVNFNPTVTISDLVPASNPYFVDGVVNIALLSIPTESIYNEDGSYNFNQNTAAGSGPFVNPIAIAEGLHDVLKRSRILLGSYLEVGLFENTKLRSQIGIDLNNWNREYYRPSWIPDRNTIAPSNPDARNFSTQGYNWTFENTLTYEKTLDDKHNLNFLVGCTAQRDLKDRNYIRATDFPNDMVQTINAGEIDGGFSAKKEWALLSYLGRVAYDYKGTYLFSASLRSDGASRFGKNVRFGYFPSVSMGVRLSDLSFFNIPFIDDFKLRGSYGETGNFSIPNTASFALLNGDDYVLNDQNANGIAPTELANPELTWEKNRMTNVGFDLELFGNKLQLTGDHYISKTVSLLMDLPIPGASGYDSTWQNVGAIENKGLELGVSSNFSLGELKLKIHANISSSKNKVVATGQNNEPIISDGGVPSTHITQVGQPIGSYYGYKVLGVFTTQEELDNFPHQSDTALGDFIFEDTDKNGVINADDRQILGNYFPDYTFGFSSKINYKRFDLNISVQGKQGFEILHLSQRYLGSLQTFSNYRADVYENAYISPEDPGNGEVYRPNTVVTNDNDAISSYHIEDGSYIRIQNITLGYSIPKQLLKKYSRIQRLKMYIATNNPFTFTKYPGYNPEVSSRPDNPLSQGEDFGTYPLAKNLILGILMTF